MSLRKTLLAYVGYTHASHKEKEKTHNDKSFLENAIRKGDQGPIIRSWLEGIVNYFASLDLGQTETQKDSGLCQEHSVRLLEAMLSLGKSPSAGV